MLTATEMASLETYIAQCSDGNRSKVPDQIPFAVAKHIYETIIAAVSLDDHKSKMKAIQENADLDQVMKAHKQSLVTSKTYHAALKSMGVPTGAVAKKMCHHIGDLDWTDNAAEWKALQSKWNQAHGVPEYPKLMHVEPLPAA